MARIPDAKPRGLIIRLIYFLTRKKVGKVVGPVKVMAHNPRILVGYGLMEQQLAKANRAPAALKLLVSIRTSTLLGCPF
jgi:hypothetical protein